jgi:hypothetical protein
MVLLQNLTICRIININLPIIVFVGECETGIAKVIFDTVFCTPCWSGGRTSIEITSFGMIDSLNSSCRGTLLNTSPLADRHKSKMTIL